MNENRDQEFADQELARVLREYQEDLRAQAPSGSVLDRLREENRRRPVVVPMKRRGISGWHWSGLAVAASLLVAVGVYRSRPAAEAPAQLAKAEPVASPMRTEAVQEEQSAGVAAPAAEKPRASEPAAPPIDPAVPPSIRAAISPQPQEPQRQETDAEARPDGKRTAKAESARVVTPAGESMADRASAKAKENAPVNAERKTVESVAVEGTATVVAEAGSAAASRTIPVLRATVLREVWEPGQVARVFTGSYERTPEGREVRSALSPSDSLAMSQNTQQQQLPAAAAPSQQMEMRRSIGGLRKAPAPARDQIAEARERVASPHTVTLGEGVIEGYRCTGLRTVDGGRTTERWHSAELGLDLFVRTTEPNGAMVVVRYVSIERRP